MWYVSEPNTYPLAKTAILGTTDKNKTFFDFVSIDDLISSALIRVPRINCCVIRNGKINNPSV